jgi:hypothetical protein
MWSLEGKHSRSQRANRVGHVCYVDPIRVGHICVNNTNRDFVKFLAANHIPWYRYVITVNKLKLQIGMPSK